MEEVMYIRREGALDLIPGVGLVKGFSSGDYIRMIPFVSPIRALGSLLFTSLSEMQNNLTYKKGRLRNLDSELKNLPTKIEEQEFLIRQLEQQIKRTEENKTSQDTKNHAIRRKLVLLSTIKLKIDSLFDNYKFLSMDVDKLARYINRNNLNKELINNFILSVREIQDTFRKTIA